MQHIDVSFCTEMVDFRRACVNQEQICTPAESLIMGLAVGWSVVEMTQFLELPRRHEEARPTPGGRRPGVDPNELIVRE